MSVNRLSVNHLSLKISIWLTKNREKKVNNPEITIKIWYIEFLKTRIWDQDSVLRLSFLKIFIWDHLFYVAPWRQNDNKNAPYTFQLLLDMVKKKITILHKWSDNHHLFDKTNAATSATKKSMLWIIIAIIEKFSERNRQRSHLCHHLYIFCRKTSEKLLTRSRLPTFIKTYGTLSQISERCLFVGYM